MDALVGSGLEPQLAIPVIVVVVGALLVYIFGFQQTEEPSLEHLAVLQSASSYKNRSIKIDLNVKGKSVGSIGNAPKAKANGHVVSEKSNGTVKKAGVTTNNKENRPPVAKIQSKKENLKDPANKPEDFESGDWIPAVSRKEKKVKKPKDEVAPPSPSKTKRGGGDSNAAADAPLMTAATTTPTKAPKIEDLLAEMKVMQDKQKENHSTQTSPDKKSTTGAKNVIDTDTSVSVAPTPSEIKKGKSTGKQAVPAAAPLPVEQERIVVAAKDEKADIKANIAFDEMGGQPDAWEEAKSRGNKKRRARKD